MKRFIFVLAVGLFALPAPAGAQIRIPVGEPAQDFPPGLFSDGSQYKVSDFKDKLLVLYFFESTCPRCRASVPERSATVMAFKGKPVKFLAVAPNTTLPQAQIYLKQTGLAMPIFVDSLGLMQDRYGFKISLQNIWQTRIIGPAGKIELGFDLDQKIIEEAQKKTDARLKYDWADYDAKLKPALEFLEFGQYGPGLKALLPFSKSSSKGVSEGAKKLIAEVKAQAEQWKAEADEAAAIEPLKAYDLYQKVAARLPADELVKASAAAAKKLATDKAIAPELAARKAYTGLVQTMSQSTMAGRPAILQTCKAIMKKYPGTPTADKVDELFRELGGKDSR